MPRGMEKAKVFKQGSQTVTPVLTKIPAAVWRMD